MKTTSLLTIREFDNRDIFYEKSLSKLQGNFIKEIFSMTRTSLNHHQFYKRNIFDEIDLSQPQGNCISAIFAIQRTREFRKRDIVYEKIHFQAQGKCISMTSSIENILLIKITYDWEKFFSEALLAKVSAS